MDLRSAQALQSLRLGHQSIADSIDSLRPFLRSYLHAKPHLREFHQRLLTFFSRQDDIFFKALYRSFQDDRNATKIIDFLAHDLKDLKIQFLIFFEKHSGEVLDQNAATFPKDFSDFCALLIARIKIEEERLFPLLEKMESR